MSEPYWAALGGGSVDYKGVWAAGAAYAPGDVVRHNGIDYLAVNPSQGVDPGVAAAPSQTMEAIGELDLAVGSTFAAIPQTYDHLVMRYRARLLNAANSSLLYMRINGDTGSVYDWSQIQLNASAITNNQNANQGEALLGVMPAASALASQYGSGEVVFSTYAEAMAQSWHGRYQGYCARSAAGMFQGLISGERYHGSPITSIGLVPQGGGVMAAGSRAWLYGIRGAAV